jgi:hypothetical protein
LFQSLGIMDRLERISRVVADPPGVHFRVIARADAIDDAFIVIKPDVLSASIDRGDRRGALEEPDALLVEKIILPGILLPLDAAVC